MENLINALNIIFQVVPILLAVAALMIISDHSEIMTSQYTASDKRSVVLDAIISAFMIMMGARWLVMSWTNTPQSDTEFTYALWGVFNILVMISIIRHVISVQRNNIKDSSK